MSINVNLNDLLLQLPDLLSWIVPGLLSILGFRSFKYEERSNEKESVSLLKAICISFFVRFAVICAFTPARSDLIYGLNKSEWVAIVSCVVAFLFGVVFGMGSNLPEVKAFSEKYLHFTIDSNPLYDLADKKAGCYVRVYLKDNKNEYLYGIYSNCYNRGNEDWIVIKDAIRIRGELDYNAENQYDSEEKTKTTKLLVNTKEVELAEFIYSETLKKKN